MACSSRRLTDEMGACKWIQLSSEKAVLRDSRMFWAETVGLKEESRENVGQRGGPAGFIVAVQSDSRSEQSRHPRCQDVSPLRVPIDGRRNGLCAGRRSALARHDEA